MSDQIKDFGRVAQGLARNPLGIIALFIVLVYGFAAILTASSLSQNERWPLIYFLVLFPVLVLGVFTWLVVNHSAKLFSPSDFRDEANYVRMQLSAVASLTAAKAKDRSEPSSLEIQEIVATVERAPVKRQADDGRILWVDDRPENNRFERGAFEAVGLRFTLALSTREALEHMARTRFAAIISDMGRREGPREGYVLLDTLRKQGDRTPFFIYASSNAIEHKRETAEHGGQGTTNNAQELFEMVTRALWGNPGSV